MVVVTEGDSEAGSGGGVTGCAAVEGGGGDIKLGVGIAGR
jgi:hypothetical protein